MKRFLQFTAVLFLGAALARALPVDDQLDVSRIIDKAAAEAVMGEPVKVPTPRNMHGNDGYYSKCNYYSARSKKAMVIRVYQAGPGFDPEKELEAVKASTGLAKPVSGLGDKAEAFSGIDGGLPNNVMMLYAIKGKALVTVGLSGLDDDEALEKAKGVVEKILAHL